MTLTRRATLPLFALPLLPILPAPARAAEIGTVSLSLGGTGYRMVIRNDSGGVDTWWDVGPVSILATGPSGGTLLLTFGEAQKGKVPHPDMLLTAADGSEWRPAEGSVSVRLTRADNLPPHFAVAGSFSARLESNGKSVSAEGTFEALLPRRDFAPTPPPTPAP